MEYDDGGAPPTEIINKWLDVVQTTFHDAPDSSGPNGNEGPAIAVHCVAGLGRAPVLVAIALIEYGKVSWHAFGHRLFPGCGKAGRAITMRAIRAWLPSEIEGQQYVQNSPLWLLLYCESPKQVAR